MPDVILHAFNWRYTQIEERAAEIAAIGYGAVLFPPPLYSDDAGAEWWQRYQPKDYRVLRSFLGTKPELERALAALRRHGVKAYADVVFNHMANEQGQRADPLHFPGAATLARYRAERAAFERDRLYGDLDAGLFSPPSDFHFQEEIDAWKDRHESTDHWLSGLPDLELNDWVVEQQRTCLRELCKLGFDGFRIDAIKHLPADHIQRVFETEELAGRFIFGEALTTSEDEEGLFLWPLLGVTRASFYDFPLYDTLRRALSSGGSLRELVDPESYGQALPRWRSVTFTVTHDIPLNDGFRGQLLDPQDEHLANAYVLGRDGGVPLVYSDQNESAGRHPCDRDRWAGAWRRGDIASMVAFHDAVHGKRQRALFEEDGFLAFARGGEGIVTINKTGAWQCARIWSWGLRLGRWRCMLHGHVLELQGGWFDLWIPPRQAQLWLWQGSEWVEK
jgi:alpha-amylase